MKYTAQGAAPKAPFTTPQICAALLNMYGEATNATPEEIQDVHTFNAQQFGRTNIYRFVYKGVKYYVSDDYSLNDTPKYVEMLLGDIDSMLTGSLLRNPIPQADGAMYASGLSGVEYYLWRCGGA